MFQFLKSRLYVFRSDRTKFGPVNPLKFWLYTLKRIGTYLWYVSLADVKNLKADVFSFLITVKPQYHEVKVATNICEMVCYRPWWFVELPHCRGVKKTFGVLVPVLKLCWEISVKNVTRHRCDFKSCLVAFENTVKDVDRKGTSKACCFGELTPTERLSDTQRNRRFFGHHHHYARLFDVLNSWSCCVAKRRDLVIISGVSFHLVQKS